MPSTRVAILGAGPAGLGAAMQLRVQEKGDVVVLEQGNDVGGNAGSFELEGLSVDYGSHRLHPACDPKILDDLRRLLGQDLIDRQRHGRIRLRQRWIHFPLKPLDLILRLPRSFALGVAWDASRKLFQRAGTEESDTFATILQRGLGRTICRDFYFPYAVKIWGLPPDELSVTQARRRVSANSLGKMARKVLSLMPGLKSPTAGRFYYPRDGYGQISRAIASKARELGAVIRLNAKVTGIRLGRPHRVELECDGGRTFVESEYIWSTLPIALLARLVDPDAAPEVLDAASRIETRAMILVYLVLGQSRFTTYDAHYFPESDIRITRLSEPKNYSLRSEPLDRTVLCAELPCSVDDELWGASDEELGELVRESLARCDLPIKSVVQRVATQRLSHAYPIYRQGYETYFNRLDDWLGGLDRVLSFGRQGLFAHDNTHHALAMAYAAVDCLDEEGKFDTVRWRSYRHEFTSHVVED